MSIGTVSSIVGTVIATDAAGNQRVLSIGDEIFEGEVIVASAGATVEIQMATGDQVVVADGQQWTPTNETFRTADTNTVDDQVVSPSDLASLESIQQALLSGQDPTQFGEATAAGAGAGAGAGGANGEGGVSFVRTARLGQEVSPEAGFDTIGTAAGFAAPALDPQIFPQVFPDPVITSITVANTDLDGGAVVEGNDLVYTVTLSDFPVNSVIYPFTIGGGTASAIDYTTLTFSNGVINNGDGTITVPEGVNSFSVTLPTVDDAEVEFTETVPLTIGGVTGTGIILDNDQPEISIAAIKAVAIEGEDESVIEFEISQDIVSVFETTVQFTLNLDEIESEDIAAITYTDALGNTVTVTDIADFLANGVELTIPANSTATPVVTITPVDDTIYEKSEAFSASISAPVNATLGTSDADAQIVDESTPGEPPREGDKPTVNLVATKAVAVEGESSAEFEVSQTNESNFATTVQFTLNLDEVEPADIAAITYTDALGNTVTVTDIADFLANGVELTIPANSTATPVVTITPVDDTIYEKSEAFSASISAPVNATLGTSDADAQIIDESTPGEPPREGDKPTVNLTAIDNIAQEGVLGDVVTFEVAQTNESNFDTQVTFTLSLGDIEAADIASITYTAANGAVVVVTDIADFIANGVQLTIPANSAAKPQVVMVPVANDSFEGKEDFSANISNPVNADLGTAGADASFIDFGVPVINLNVVDGEAIEGKVGDDVVFNISQSNQSYKATSVLFKLAMGELEAADIQEISYTDAAGNTVVVTGATAIADFISNGVTLTIPADSVAMPSVTVTPVDDAIYEKSESFSATISTPSNATIGVSTGNAKIIDESTPGEPPREGDKPTVNLVVTKAVAVEGESSAEFEVSQTNESNFATTVQFTLNLDEVEPADIAAITYTDALGNTVTVTDIADFLANGVELTIPANSTATPVVTITPVDDTIYEKSEAFSASISAPVNATLGTSDADAQIIDESTPGEPPREGD
jgi:hypothetical protein